MLAALIMVNCSCERLKGDRRIVAGIHSLMPTTDSEFILFAAMA